MKYLTKGMVNPLDKQKVYYSCHKEDNGFLEEISKEFYMDKFYIDGIVFPNYEKIEESLKEYKY